MCCLVLHERVSIILDTMIDSAADVIFEIGSPESVDRDLVGKYDEYETYSVREYWVINPVRKQTDFYVLGDDKLYHRIELVNGVFHSMVLPQFHLPTASLWDTTFLDDSDNARALVEAMLT